jgi:hypothetical protein
MIQAIAGAAGGGLLVGALLAAWAVGSYKDATWSAATNQLKVEAADLLQKETEKALLYEREANVKVRELEAQHAQEEKDLAAIQQRNRQLARELGGLRDPGRRPSSTDAVPTTSTSAGDLASASTSGLLSAETSEVLLAAAAEADQLAQYAKTCYDWKEIVTAQYTAITSAP